MKQSEEGTPHTGLFVRSMSSVSPFCVVLYLAVVIGLFVSIKIRDHNVFTYTLDDPYIHLALAENLAHGHYGINPGEASSPSSSILWPFLLVPFADRTWNVYLPLAWNVLFCGMSAWLVGRFVDGWYEAQFSRMVPEVSGIGCWAPWIERLGLATALMLVANLAGLTFVGMEHGLQVLIAIVCAAGMVQAYVGRRIPEWCIWVAALGPMVRYEDFALMAGVAIGLYGQGRLWTAIRMAALSLVGPAIFSLFLLHHGLAALPSSVLVKGNMYGGSVMAVLRAMHGTTMRERAWWKQLLIAILLTWLFVRERERSKRAVVASALLVAALQLTLGRFNWFHRYEVYALIFTVLVASTALVYSTRISLRYLILGLLIIAFPYEQALLNTPAGASNVFQQQYQMHRFETEFYRKTVAVNDLGLVSYHRPSGVYVLDLWGLASPEAARQAVKDSPWLDGITREHGAGLAMIIPEWFKVPEDWHPLATMCISEKNPTSIALRCMVFYSTEVGDQNELTNELKAFAQTLPAGMKMTLGRDSTDADE